MVWIALIPVESRVSFAAEPEAAKNILILYADTPEYLAYPIFTNNFQNRMKERVEAQVTYSYEYLSWTQHSTDSAYANALSDFLTQKYRGNQPDIVVLLGGPAAQFFISRGEQLFPGVPKIVAGATLAGYSEANLPKNFTILQSSYDAPKAVEAILKIQPATKKSMSSWEILRLSSEWSLNIHKNFKSLPAKWKLSISIKCLSVN